MNTRRSPALPVLLLLAACGPMPGESAGYSSSTSDSPTSTDGSTGDDRPGPSGEAPSSPTTGNSGTGSGTSSTSTTDPANVTSETSTSTSTGETSTGDASTASSSTSGSSTASESGDDSTSTGDTPEVVPLCFGDPCDTLCGPGLVCLPHPTTGEGMCVTQCLASPTCDGVVSALCGEGPTLKVPNTACIFNACFPRTCIVLADCPNSSTECFKGICY